jgi:MCM N-terminal domain
MNLTCPRDQLRQNVLVKQYYCDIDIAHLITYNEELAHKLTTEPTDIIPLVNPQYNPNVWSAGSYEQLLVRVGPQAMYPANSLSLPKRHRPTPTSAPSPL